MRKFLYILFSIFILVGCSTSPRVLLGTPTAVPSFYVSPSGNDNSPCTQSLPCKTITRAMSVATSGSIIYVRAGTYPAFTVSKNDLTITGYSGERPLISGGKGIELRGRNITISGFEVVSMVGNLTAGITSYGNFNIIQNNIVHDNTYTKMSGIIVSGGSNNQVLDNVVYNNNKFGIGVYGATALNNLISRNTSYNHTLSAGDSDGIHCSGGASKNTFTNNITYGNSDDGLDTWDCFDNLASNNVSHHNGGTGDGNGFKFGLGGKNSVTYNTAYSNYVCGFTSNGAGNYYEGNISYSNGFCGFEDGWRVVGNTQTSSFINNLAYNNPRNFNLYEGMYISLFLGNSETPPTVTATPSVTPTWEIVTIVTDTAPATFTPTPTRTPTATPTGYKIFVNGTQVPCPKPCRIDIP